MKCSEIMRVIERKYGRELALGWDNVGLLVGREDKDVSRIYVALDATDEVVERAISQGADMLLTHHPLIFSGMKRITGEDFIGRRILRLAQADISYYAMHTNYDVAGMADAAAFRLGWPEGKVLEVTGENADGGEMGIGRIADLAEPVSLKECCEQVKKAFSLDTVQVFGDLGKRVERAALCPGSGKSVIPAAAGKGADVLITGDIGHHEGIDAVAQGMAVVDAGHYGMEHIFVEDIAVYLEKSLSGVMIERDVGRTPFLVV